MQGRDASDEAQPESRAGRGSAAIHAIEAAQHEVAFELWHAGPVVRDVQDDAAIDCVETDVDPCAPRCMSQRVLDQVGKNLSQQAPIPGHFQVCAVGRLEHQRMIQLGGGRLIKLADRFTQTQQIDRLDPRFRRRPIRNRRST